MVGERGGFNREGFLRGHHHDPPRTTVEARWTRVRVHCHHEFENHNERLRTVYTPEMGHAMLDPI